MQRHPANIAPKRTGATRIAGVVERVDMVAREIVVRLAGSKRIIDVPPDCLITLHAQPVKLRLVQPGDRVAVWLAGAPVASTAIRLEAQPEILGA